jgi:hypothetical protein
VFDGLADGDALAATLGADVSPIVEGARLAVTLRRSRAEHLDRLREAMPPALPLLYLPYLFVRSHGMRSTRYAAEALGAELGY